MPAAAAAEAAAACRAAATAGESPVDDDGVDSSAAAASAVVRKPVVFDDLSWRIGEIESVPCCIAKENGRSTRGRKRERGPFFSPSFATSWKKEEEVRLPFKRFFLFPLFLFVPLRQSRASNASRASAAGGRIRDSLRQKNKKLKGEGE